ncbi:hypothetical protein [Saccharopolyspora shandongensis]
MDTLRSRRWRTNPEIPHPSPGEVLQDPDDLAFELVDDEIAVDYIQ